MDSDSEELGSWECSLCTYRNSTDKFKCEICDLRRGTSTRKPRCNADTIVAQVVKQQEQIRQQTRVKPSTTTKTARTSSSGGGNTAPGNNTASPSVPRTKRPKLAEGKSRRARSTNNNSNNNNGDDSDTDSDSNSTTQNVLAKKTKKSSTREDGDSSDSESTDATEASDDVADYTYRATNSSSPTQLHMSSPGSSSLGESFSSAPSSPTISPEPTTSSPVHSSSATTTTTATTTTNATITTTTSKQPKENSFKPIPFEINGNLIKYSPPTSSGRTGLIIDKKRFTQYSVTVNDVSVTFTEFATRQNKYIRKKKKRRDTKARSNGSLKKSTTKAEPKSPNAAPSTAAADC